MSDGIRRLTAALADRYTIERELGAGGMATVYLAEDLRHERQVAIKVLKPELAAVLGAERFVQEIKTTASLQHPHILPLFDSGAADGFLFYVMPFIDGETLRAKLDRETQLGVDEAIRITCEVADALDYAHGKGVVHRDIKPENILLANGRPMVADFGIALAVSAAAGGRMTETGLSLGTPHYMSPEQATADKEITGRSDIYSLASVLYELLTGDPPHTGSSAQQIIMKIVAEEAAPVTKVRKSVPPNVVAALSQALEKVPADRFRTALEFADALGNPNFTTTRHQAAAPAAASRRNALLLGVVAVVAGSAGVFAGRALAGSGGANASDDPVHAALPLGDSVVLRPINNASLAISPDGRRVAFVGVNGASSGLWVRELGSDHAVSLPGTNGGEAPFFSPDGQTVAFLRSTGSGADVLTTPASGGSVQTIVKAAASGYGASWGDDGYIYYSDRGASLARVPAIGGNSEVVATADTARGIHETDYPDVLPGSRYAVVQLYKGAVEVSSVGLIDLATGATRELAPATYARYVDPGILAFANAAGEISVMRFDPGKGVLLDPTPTLVLSGVQRENSNGTVAFAVARNGTLVYIAGRSGGDRLVRVTMDGTIAPVDSSLNGSFSAAALSPDGRSVALSRNDAGAEGVWIKQLPKGALTRLTGDEPGADRPAWTPDGRSVAFLAIRGGRRAVWIRRADGSDPSARPLSPPGLELDEVAFDPRGRFVVFRTYGSASGSRHLMVMPSSGDSAPRLLIASAFDHYAPAVSPDGHWIAYVSEESGRAEVLVRPFPNADSARIAVSVGGGYGPAWAKDGHTLYYRDPRGAMMAVEIRTTPAFSHGTPRTLFFDPGLLSSQYHRSYDVAPDGTGFLMIEAQQQANAQIRVVLGWRQQIERAAAR